MQGSCWELQFWTQWPPVELLLNADHLPTAWQAPFHLRPLPVPQHHREVRAAISEFQRGGNWCSEGEVMKATGTARMLTQVCWFTSQRSFPIDGLYFSIPGYPIRLKGRVEYHFTRIQNEHTHIVTSCIYLPGTLNPHTINTLRPQPWQAV